MPVRTKKEVSGKAGSFLDWPCERLTCGELGLSRRRSQIARRAVPVRECCKCVHLLLIVRSILQINVISRGKLGRRVRTWNLHQANAKRCGPRIFLLGNSAHRGQYLTAMIVDVDEMSNRFSGISSETRWPCTLVQFGSSMSHLSSTDPTCILPMRPGLLHLCPLP